MYGEALIDNSTISVYLDATSQQITLFVVRQMQNALQVREREGADLTPQSVVSSMFSTDSTYGYAAT